MRWGVTVLTVALLMALVLASGCADVSFGSQKIGDFGSTKEEQKAVEFFKEKYGDPLTNSGPPRFLEPMVTSGLVNNTPVNKVTKFSKDTGSIFFWVFYDNFKKGDTLTLTWTFNGKTVISLQREAGGDFGRAFGEFLKPDKGWATGTHTITITGGGTSATATFEIIDGATVTESLPYEQAGRALPVTASTTSGNEPSPGAGFITATATPMSLKWGEKITFSGMDYIGNGVGIRLYGPVELNQQALNSEYYDIGFVTHPANVDQWQWDWDSTTGKQYLSYWGKPGTYAFAVYSRGDPSKYLKFAIEIKGNESSQPNAAVPLKLSASSNTVQWCDNVTFYVSDTTGTGHLDLSFNGPGIRPGYSWAGIYIAELVRPAAPAIDWKYTWDTSENYGNDLTKQAAEYTVYAMDENKVHIISMPLQMKGDKLIHGQCPGTVVDYWISGGGSKEVLSCSPPNNVITFSGNTGSAVPTGTPVQLKIFSRQTSGPLALPQNGVLIGSTNTDNSGLWKYTWNGIVPGYTLKDGEDYLIKPMLSDTMYTQISFLYQCPTQTSCLSGAMSCNGQCIDVTKDYNNCGSCGYTCSAGQICQNGQCVATTISPGTSSYHIAREIDQGATIFIGESGLDVTKALLKAQNKFPPSTPDITKIGWWAPGSFGFPANPSKVVDLGTMYRNMVVDPNTFAAYTGSWYLLNSATTNAYSTVPVFLVFDPSINIAIQDFSKNGVVASQGADVTNSVVPQGDLLGFWINTNMYRALDSQLRSPVYNNQQDGYIDIRVQDPSGNVFTSVEAIDPTRGTPAVQLLLQQPVDKPLYIWGDPQTAPWYPARWNTGAMNSKGEYLYPTGTYKVWAESKLNGMIDNYKNNGANFVGKTITYGYTVTIVPKTP